MKGQPTKDSLFAVFILSSSDKTCPSPFRQPFANVRLTAFLAFLKEKLIFDSLKTEKRKNNEAHSKTFTFSGRFFKLISSNFCFGKKCHKSKI